MPLKKKDELNKMFEKEPLVRISHLLDEIHKICKSYNFKGKVDIDIKNEYSRFTSQL